MPARGFRAEVSTNLPQLIEWLSGTVGKQVPFAAASALTRTAQHAQKAVQDELPQVFTIRSRWVVRGIRINRAEKRDWPNIFAEVGTRDEFMADHALGAIRRPRDARRLAIPRRIVPRTATGRTRASYKPRRLMSKKNVFLHQPDGGDSFIARRTRGEFQALYLLRPSVRIEKRWDFEGTVQRVASARYQPEFFAAFDKAISTPKRPRTRKP